MSKVTKIVLCCSAVVMLILTVMGLVGMTSDQSVAEPVITGSCGAGAEDNVTYEVVEENGTVILRISGTGAMADYADAGDQPWHDYLADDTLPWENLIQKIEVGAGITHIGDRAFMGMIVRWLGYSASIEIEEGSNLRSIGDYAFYVDDTGSYGSMHNNVRNPLPAGLETIGDYAFYGASFSADFPDSVTTIGNHAFAGCDNRYYASVGTGLTTVGEYAVCFHTVQFRGEPPENMQSNSFVNPTGGSLQVKVDNAEGWDADKLARISSTAYLVDYNEVQMVAKVIGATHGSSETINLPWRQPSHLPWNGKDVVSIEYSNIDSIDNNPVRGMAPICIGQVSNKPTSIVVDGSELLIKVGPKEIPCFRNGDERMVMYNLPRNITELTADDLNGIEIILWGDTESSLERITVPASVKFVSLSNLPELKYVKVEAPLVDDDYGKPMTLSYGGVSGYTDGIVISESGLDIIDISMTRLKSVSVGNAKTVLLPPTMVDLRVGAFRGCTALENIDLTNVQKVDNSAFYGCTSLRTVDMPQCVSIGDSAFYGCTSLVHADLPVCATIEKSAFAGCSSLGYINIEQCTKIKAHAFSSTGLETFTFPRTDITIGYNIWINSKLRNIILPDGYTGSNTFVGGVLLTDNGKKMVWGPGSGTFLSIPEGVETIGYGSMTRSGVKNILIPPTVKEIDTAFAGSYVEYIYFTDSDALTEIQANAFNSMQRLKAVYYEGEQDPGALCATLTQFTVQVRGTPDQFSISFETNGGGAVEAIHFDVYLTQETQLPVPVKQGSVFCGWYADEGLTDIIGPKVPSGLIGNRTYYAMWADPSDFICDAGVISFSGPSAIIRISSDSVPEGNIIVRYSQFIGLAEGVVLNPFMTDTIHVDEGTDTIAYTNPTGQNIRSCSVTFCYTVGLTNFYTPLNYAVAPATCANIDMDVDIGMAVMFGDRTVSSGDLVDFGTYAVTVTGAGAFRINGVLWENGGTLFYGGQRLVITRVV